MFSKWPIFRPPSLLSNSLHRKSLIFFIGVLLIAFFSVAQANNSTRLVNISSRCIVKSGVGNTIAGFIIEGGSKTIIIRGLGRGLGLSPNLDVEMEVTKYPSSEFVARNDNWQSDIRAAEIPSHLQLPDATDAGLLLTLPAGAYTAVVKPKGANGIGLVSVDDLDDPQSTSRLINISTRCSVEKSDKNAIAGFIIKGTGTQSVLIGALGKGLGLSLNLDTQMAVSKYPSGELMESNESWQRHRNAAQIPTHLQLPDPSDAGLLLDLPAGAYTAVVKPTGEIGIGLVAVNAISSGSPPPSTPKYSSTPASGSTLNFGSTPVGTPVSSDLIISEAGNADLVLNSSRISGTNANDFRVLTAFPLTLPDNAVYIQAPTVTLQCTPSGENLRTASLQISTNEGTHSYPLECTGSNGCPTSQSTTCPVLNNLSPPSEDLIPWLGAGVDSDRNWLKQEECLDGVITPLGKSVTDLSAKLISSFKDVLEIQKMNAGGKLSIKFFKAHANANYEKMFRQTSYMQSYVLNYNVDLGSERIGNISISERGKIAAQNACDFRRYCGDKYVSEITKGGKVYVEMNFKFKTTQQKTEFSAGGGFGFAGEICCVPFSIDLEASVSRLSQKTRKESSLEVVAHQEGGKVEDLIKIFGSTGNSTSCSLDNLAPCKKAIDDIIAYVQDGFAETLRDYPSVSKYKYSGFDYVIGVPDLVSDVTPEIEQAREALAVEYEKRLVDLDKVRNLLQYTLPDEREQKMTALQDALKNDVESLSKAGVVCFNDLSNCLAEKCEVFKTLVSYDPKELALQLEDGLLLHLPLDGDVSDVSWNQNHGQLQEGRLTYTNDAILGKAAYFDGSTVVKIPNTKPFRFANSSFTFSVWVDVIDNPPYSYRGYISLSDNFDKRIELAKYRAKAGGQIYMQIYSPLAASLDSGATLQAKGWLHLVSVVDQAQGKIILYINGIKQGATDLIDFNQLNPTLSIGSCVVILKKGAPCRHKGPMDEVRIWDRALSEGEIEGLYNAGKK